MLTELSSFVSLKELRKVSRGTSALHERCLHAVPGRVRFSKPGTFSDGRVYDFQCRRLKEVGILTGEHVKARLSHRLNSSPWALCLGLGGILKGFGRRFWFRVLLRELSKCLLARQTQEFPAGTPLETRTDETLAVWKTNKHAPLVARQTQTPRHESTRQGRPLQLIETGHWGDGDS
ncbi:hypothetical protein BaRGS_00029691, partial [Batillaria attramentaria]